MFRNIKNLSFSLEVEDIPISFYSSFLFNTYEYNDRKIILDQNYILFINIRETNKRTILGNINLDDIYKITVIKVKANIISFI